MIYGKKNPPFWWVFRIKKSTESKTIFDRPYSRGRHWAIGFAFSNRK